MNLKEGWEGSGLDVVAQWRVWKRFDLRDGQFAHSLTTQLVIRFKMNHTQRLRSAVLGSSNTAHR
jgi:hypothetical protein